MTLRTAPLVEVSGLGFGYGASAAGDAATAVLRDVSFSIGAGELVALCGPNGAGKSTLLRLLLGLHSPARGQIRLGGAPLPSLSRREIARRAALLPQDAPADLPLTAREAVSLGRLAHLDRFQPASRADEEAVARALVAADLLAFADRPVAELSGGERHRVHLARALAQESPLLLLDEPVSGLDLAHQVQVLDLLRAMADAGRGVLVALHDLSLAARRCDRMILLSGGTVRIDATPDEVVTPALLAEVFAVRAEVLRDGAGRPLVVPLAALDPAGRPEAVR